MRFLLFVIFFFSFVSTIFASPQIIVNSIEPSLIQPGQDITLSLKLVNNKNDEIDINTIDFDLGDNFILKSNDLGELPYKLCSSCSREVNFYLIAKSNLESGTYIIESTIRYDGQLNYETTIPIEVSGIPNLVIDIENNPIVVPEKPFNLTLHVKNEGTGIAKNIKIVPSSQSFGFIGENSLFIKEIKPNSDFSISGVLLSSKSVESGYFELPLNVVFEDSQSNNLELDESIGFDILDDSNIVLQHIQVESTLVKGESGRISLRIENDGYGDAKEVRVNLEGNFDGQKEAFFGTLKKGDDLPFTFNIIPKESGLVEYSIVINYYDDFGEKENSFNSSINVESQNNIIFYIIGGITIILIIFILIFVRK